MGSDSTVIEENVAPQPQTLRQEEPVDDAAPVPVRTNEVLVGPIADTTARTNLSADSQDIEGSRQQATAELSRLIEVEHHLPGFQLTELGAARMRRDASGQIDQITDEKGNVFKFGRDPSGNITSFTDSTGVAYTSKNGFNFEGTDGKKLNGVFAIDEQTGTIHFLGMEGHFERRPNGDTLIAPAGADSAPGSPEAPKQTLPLDQQLNNAVTALSEVANQIDGNAFAFWMTGRDNDLGDTVIAIIKDNREHLDELRAAYKLQHPDGDLDKDLLAKLEGAPRDRLEKLLTTRSQPEYDAWEISHALQGVAGSARPDNFYDEEKRGVNERILRETLSGLSPEQIAKIDEAYKQSHQGRSMAEDFANDPHMSEQNKKALAIQLSSASPDEKTAQLGELALATRDLGLFHEAFRDASPAAREAFQQQHGQQLEATFKGKDLDKAKQYLSTGELDLATRIRENIVHPISINLPILGDIGNFSNKGAIDQLLNGMSEQQHIDYIAGAQLQNKTDNLTTQQQRQKDFYESIGKALKDAGDAKDQAHWNDLIMNGGSLVSAVISKGGAGDPDAVFNAIEKMSEADFKRLHDPNNPQFRQQVIEALGTVLSGNDLQRATELLDKQVKAEKPGDPNNNRGVLETLADRTSGFSRNPAEIVETLSRMSPQEQQRYASDAQFKKQVQDAFHKAMGETYARTDGVVEGNTAVLDRLFAKLDAGTPPALGAVERILLAANQDRNHVDRLEVANDIARAYKDDPTLKARVNNPQTLEDEAISKAFNSAFNKAFPPDEVSDLPRSRADYLVLLREGTLPVDLKVSMQTDFSLKLAELTRASAAEKKLLQDSDPNNAEAVALRQKTFAGMTPEQMQLSQKVAGQTAVLPEDVMRAFILGGKGIASEQISELLSKLTPAQIQAAKENYELTYKQNLIGDLLPKVNHDQFHDVERKLAKQLTAREMLADVVARDEASRTGLAGMLAQVKDGTTLQSAEAASEFLRTVQKSESYKNLSPAMQRQVREYMEASFAQQKATKDQIADLAVNVATIGIAVAAAPFTGGESLVLSAAVFGTVGVVTQTAGKQMMLGADYDPSTRWRDAVNGGVGGALGVLGVPGLQVAGRGAYLIKAGADGAYSGAVSAGAVGALEWRNDQSFEENVARISTLMTESAMQGAGSGIGFAGVIHNVTSVAGAARARLERPAADSVASVEPPAGTNGTPAAIDKPPGAPDRPVVAPDAAAAAIAARPAPKEAATAWGAKTVDDSGVVTAITTRDGTFVRDGDTFKNVQNPKELISDVTVDGDGNISYKHTDDGTEVRIDGTTGAATEVSINKNTHVATLRRFEKDSNTPSGAELYAIDPASGERTMVRSFTKKDGTWRDEHDNVMGTTLQSLGGYLYFTGSVGTQSGPLHVGKQLGDATSKVEVTAIQVMRNGDMLATVQSAAGSSAVVYNRNGEVLRINPSRDLKPGQKGLTAEFEYEALPPGAAGAGAEQSPRTPVRAKIDGQEYTRRADGIWLDSSGNEYAKSIETSGGIVKITPVDSYRWPGNEYKDTRIAAIELRPDGTVLRRVGDPQGQTDKLVPRDQDEPNTPEETLDDKEHIGYRRPVLDEHGKETGLFDEDIGEGVVRTTSDGVLKSVTNADGYDVRFKGADLSNLDSVEYWKDGKLDYSLQRSGDHFEKVYANGQREALTVTKTPPADPANPERIPVDRLSIGSDGSVTQHASYEKTLPNGTKFKTWQSDRLGTDGVVVHIDEFGRERVDAASFARERQRLKDLSETFSGADGNRRQRFQNLMDEWETNARKNGISEEEIANVYFSMNKTLSADNAVTPLPYREQAVQQLMLELAHNNYIDQGSRPTCQVTASHEVRGMVGKPDVMADMLAQDLITGQYITFDGHIIDLQAANGTLTPQRSDSSLTIAKTDVADPNNFDDLSAHDWGNARSYVDQVLQTTMVNTYWQMQSVHPQDGTPRRSAMTVDEVRAGKPYQPADLRSEIGSITKPNAQSSASIENITDYSKQPPEVLVLAKPSDGVNPLTGEPARVFTEDLVTNPALSDDMILAIDKYLYGPNASTDYYITAGNSLSPRNVADVPALTNRLLDLKKDGLKNMPAVVAVESGNIVDIDGKPFDGEGRHVINVHDIFENPPGSGKYFVYVTNQWGPKFDYLEKNPLPIETLYDWMTAKPKAPDAVPVTDVAPVARTAADLDFAAAAATDTTGTAAANQQRAGAASLVVDAATRQKALNDLAGIGEKLDPNNVDGQDAWDAIDALLYDHSQVMYDSERQNIADIYKAVTTPGFSEAAVVEQLQALQKRIEATKDIRLKLEKNESLLGASTEAELPLREQLTKMISSGRAEDAQSLMQAIRDANAALINAPPGFVDKELLNRVAAFYGTQPAARFTEISAALADVKNLKGDSQAARELSAAIGTDAQAAVAARISEELEQLTPENKALLYECGSLEEIKAMQNLMEKHASPKDQLQAEYEKEMVRQLSSEYPNDDAIEALRSKVDIAHVMQLRLEQSGTPGGKGMPSAAAIEAVTKARAGEPDALRLSPEALLAQANAYDKLTKLEVPATSLVKLPPDVLLATLDTLNSKQPADDDIRYLLAPALERLSTGAGGASEVRQALDILGAEPVARLRFLSQVKSGEMDLVERKYVDRLIADHLKDSRVQRSDLTAMLFLKGFRQKPYADEIPNVAQTLANHAAEQAASATDPRAKQSWAELQELLTATGADGKPTAVSLELARELGVTSDSKAYSDALRPLTLSARLRGMPDETLNRLSIDVATEPVDIISAQRLLAEYQRRAQTPIDSLSNFDYVTPGLMRGALPTAENASAAFADLAGRDVRTVLDLTGRANDAQRAAAAEQNVKYATWEDVVAAYNRKHPDAQLTAPMADSEQSQLNLVTKQHLDAAAEFIQQQSEDGGTYVMCDHGRDRTGAVIAQWQRSQVDAAGNRVYSDEQIAQDLVSHGFSTLTPGWGQKLPELLDIAPQALTNLTEFASTAGERASAKVSPGTGNRWFALADAEYQARNQGKQLPPDQRFQILAATSSDAANFDSSTFLALSKSLINSRMDSLQPAQRRALVSNVLDGIENNKQLTEAERQEIFGDLLTTLRSKDAIEGPTKNRSFADDLAYLSPEQLKKFADRAGKVLDTIEPGEATHSRTGLPEGQARVERLARRLSPNPLDVGTAGRLLNDLEPAVRAQIVQRLADRVDYTSEAGLRNTFTTALAQMQQDGLVQFKVNSNKARVQTINVVAQTSEGRALAYEFRKLTGVEVNIVDKPPPGEKAISFDAQGRSIKPNVFENPLIADFHKDLNLFNLQNARIDPSGDAARALFGITPEMRSPNATPLTTDELEALIKPANSAAEDQRLLASARGLLNLARREASQTPTSVARASDMSLEIVSTSKNMVYAKRLHDELFAGRSAENIEGTVFAVIPRDANDTNADSGHLALQLFREANGLTDAKYDNMFVTEAQLAERMKNHPESVTRVVAINDGIGTGSEAKAVADRAHQIAPGKEVTYAALATTVEGFDTLTSDALTNYVAGKVFKPYGPDVDQALADLPPDAAARGKFRNHKGYAPGDIVSGYAYPHMYPNSVAVANQELLKAMGLLGASSERAVRSSSSGEN